MEKEKLFANAACLNWQCSSTMDTQLAQLNSEQLPMLMNLHLESSVNQTAEFESSYSSIVSSPQALGTICNPPLSSPPKLNLAMAEPQARGNHPISVKTMVPFPTDPGFAERAAKNSCFGNQSCVGGLELPYISKMENGKLPRVSSSQSLKPHASLVGSAENNREESSVSEQITNEARGRKRKAAPPKGRAKDNAKASEDDDSDTKRSKSSDTSGTEKPKAEQGGNQKQSKDSSKPPEPPKDYIHVRARRGQATDSHSLAERVRREKISERMKVLQDLVPGCNKVTGKAVMLDEIINYVQSLQRQVEFLSMKLATVNPRLDFDIESLLSKDVYHPRNGLPPNGSSFALDSTLSAFPFAHHPPAGPPEEGNFPINHLPAPLRRSLSMHLPTMDGFGEAAAQLAGVWEEDDLQTVVQMGYGHNQDQMFPTQNFHGTLQTAQMKVEL